MSFEDLSGKGEGGTAVSVIGVDAKGDLQAQSTVTISSTLTGTLFEAAVLHEGSQVADAQAVAKSISITDSVKGTVGITHEVSRYQSEQRAFRVTDAVFRKANESHQCACGVGIGCTLGIGLNPRTQLPETIDKILRYSPLYRSNGKPLSETNQGGSILIIPSTIR